MNNWHETMLTKIAPTFICEDGEPFDGDHSFAFASIEEGFRHLTELRDFIVANRIISVTWGHMTWNVSEVLARGA